MVQRQGAEDTDRVLGYLSEGCGSMTGRGKPWMSVIET